MRNFLSAPALSLSLLMVISARLSWLREQVLAGHNVTVHFSYNSQTGKDKVRFLINRHGALKFDESNTSSLIPSAIDLVSSSSICHAVVDRGHRFSDGSAEACFWIQPRSLTRATTSLCEPPAKARKLVGLPLSEVSSGCVRGELNAPEDFIGACENLAMSSPELAAGSDVGARSAQVCDSAEAGMDHVHDHAFMDVEAEESAAEVDIPGQSWDRKEFRTVHDRVKDADVSNKIWAWIKGRYDARHSKSTMRCERMLEGLSQKELLAAIRFMKSGDEIDLVMPLFSIRHAADIETAPVEPVGQAAASSSGGDVVLGSADTGGGGGTFKLAGVNKRGMAQSKAQSKRR